MEYALIPSTGAATSKMEKENDHGKHNAFAGGNPPDYSMVEDPRIAEARKLMIAVTTDERSKTRKERQEFIDNMICSCGHKHVEHTSTYSINYTGGFCTIADCKCRNFLILKHK